MLKRPTLQMAHNPFERSVMKADDEMNVIGKNRAGVNRVISLFDRFGKTSSDGARLDAGEQDGIVFQYAFCCGGTASVVGDVRD